MAFDNNDVTHACSKNDFIPIAKFDLCKGLAEQDINHLLGVLRLTTFQPGDIIINEGNDADNLFFLVRGNVSVTISLPDGSVKKLRTLSSGMVFGEMAIIERSKRSADVRADTTVSCYTLSVGEFDKLGETKANIKTTLLINFALVLSEKLSKANQKISTLE